jgi:hypothetical protein
MTEHIASRVAGLVALSLAGAACSGTSMVVIAGSGQNKTDDRQVAAFDAIAVSGPLTAMITLAPDRPQQVQVSGDANLVALVRTTVSGSELLIDLTPSTNFAPKLPLVITVSAQALRALKADDVAQAFTNAVSGADVSLATSDSASVTVASLSATNSLTIASDNVSQLKAAGITAGGAISLTADHSSHLEVTGIQGSGAVALTADNLASVVVTGAAPALTAHVARSASVRAEQLSAATVTITASNLAAAQVCATSSLDAALTLSSQIGYHCDPASVTKTVDETSTLTKE